MAKSNPELISALRQTASRLSDGAKYEWGHMGRCNCGHLVQTLTEMTDREIVASMDHQMDEWSEHAKDYCNNTSTKVDDIFNTMQEVGFDYQDMIDLEYLSDKDVLQRLGKGNVYLQRNNVEDVILYMETMAAQLEEELM